MPKDSAGDIIFADEDDYVTTWLEMEKCVELGLTKSIGVSNFNNTQIKRIIGAGNIRPACNQIEVKLYYGEAISWFDLLRVWSTFPARPYWLKNVNRTRSSLIRSLFFIILHFAGAPILDSKRDPWVLSFAEDRGCCLLSAGICQRGPGLR